jgi:Flp pilus assembly protein TadG
MRRRHSWLRRFISPALRVGRSFAREERGATAIEFAILALPFFSLIYAILETSIVFLSGQILDSAVQDAARKVRTGQAQLANWADSRFREEICDRLYGMFDCDGLRIKVTVVSSFATATVEPPVGEECQETGDAEDCEWTIVEEYTPGTGSSIVLLQVYYKWPTFINMPGINLATQADNSRLLSAVRVFRNEPFS